MNDQTVESLKAIDDAAAKLAREIRAIATSRDPVMMAFVDLAIDQITIIRVSAATIKKIGD